MVGSVRLKGPRGNQHTGSGLQIPRGLIICITRDTCVGISSMSSAGVCLAPLLQGVTLLSPTPVSVTYNHAGTYAILCGVSDSVDKF